MSVAVQRCVSSTYVAETSWRTWCGGGLQQQNSTEKYLLSLLFLTAGVPQCSLTFDKSSVAVPVPWHPGLGVTGSGCGRLS